MRNVLPSNPSEVLDLSTKALRVKVYVAVLAAEIFKYWRYPLKNAATAFEEMTLRDIYYWVYKSKNPITRMERGYAPQEVFFRDRRVVKVPDGFKPSVSITVGACGDILYNDRVRHSKNKLFERIDDLLFSRDIAYTNFESPITSQSLVKEVIGDRAPPIECCSIEQFDIVKGHAGRSFDIMNITNNHIFDMGLEGVETTIENLIRNEIIDSGTNARPEDYGYAKILIKNGVKIGFAAVTFGLNGHVVPKGEEYRIYTAKLLSTKCPPDIENIKMQIEYCKQEKCDFIVASLHWGFEFEFFPRMVQVEVARELIEFGADTIICHHPHVIQPVEYYRTQRDLNRIAIIAYSLGSLLWGFGAPHIALSLILNLTIAKGRLHGDDVSYVSDVNVMPVFPDTRYEDGQLVTRIEKLCDWPNRSFGTSVNDIKEMKKYVSLVLG